MLNNICYNFIKMMKEKEISDLSILKRPRIVKKAALYIKFFFRLLGIFFCFFLNLANLLQLTFFSFRDLRKRRTHLKIKKKQKKAFGKVTHF